MTLSDDDSSSDDDGGGSKPLSVNDMRRQAAEKIRPQSATVTGVSNLTYIDESRVCPFARKTII
jgi:hypothetical protein